jgi:hypothetical protein
MNYFIKYQGYLCSLKWLGLNIVILVLNNQHCARVVGYGPFSLCIIHKEGLSLSSGDINSLMMMMERNKQM